MVLLKATYSNQKRRITEYKKHGQSRTYLTVNSNYLVILSISIISNFQA